MASIPPPEHYPAPLVAWSAALPPAYPHDAALARQEFDAAGWRLHGDTRAKNGQPLVLAAAIDATLPIVARIALLVQEQLAPFGVQVSIKPYAPTILTAPDGPLRTGHFGFSPASLIGGSDPEQAINLQCAQARNGGPNYSRYCSPRLEALFSAQMNAASERLREHDFDAIASVVHDDVPLIPLYDLLYLQGVDKRVSGYKRNMLRFPVRPEEWDAR